MLHLTFSEQRFKVTLQNKPVLLVHAVVPQMHGAVFNLYPVVCEHIVPPTQMQERVVEHASVEDVSAFNIRPLVDGRRVLVEK